jgi:BirA family transcriptional regulator, biotin operon repressor / biotin---[acetyl-CoA-carboxylase] ligase
MTTAPRLPSAYRLIAFDRLGSSNDEAKALAAAGAADGTLVWACEQTAGRGRQGRRFVSPRGNLYCSIVLRPSCALAQAAQLGLVAAVALADTLAGLLPAAAEIRQKWPNDLLINDRKTSGILLESAARGPDRLDWLVLGLGVNIVSHPEGTEFPATDLHAEGAGAEVSVVTLLEGFAKQFLARRLAWLLDGWPEIRRDWLARAWRKGLPMRARLEGETLHGVFADLDEDGALLLDLAGGARRRITAGDMFALTG